jgi:anhydro-N-acetylmuramic acid kinase
MQRETRAVGLMSGTSLDGIDVALIETDGERVTHFGPTAIDPYADEAKSVLRQALEAGRTPADRTARPGMLVEAERSQRVRPPAGPMTMVLTFAELKIRRTRWT